MTVQSGVAYRRDVIRKGHAYVREDSALFRKFCKAVSSTLKDGEVRYSDRVIDTLHNAMLDFAFHAYTKWRFTTIVKKAKLKRKSGDSSNVAFRHRIAAQSSRSGGRKGGRKNSTRRGSKAIAEMEAKYKAEFAQAVQKLRTSDGDISGLFKAEICAILFCGYGKFYRHKNDSHVTAGSLKETLQKRKDRCEEAFIRNLEQKVAGTGQVIGNDGADDDDTDCPVPEDIDIEIEWDGDDMICEPVGDVEDEDELVDYFLQEEDDEEDVDDLEDD